MLDAAFAAATLSLRFTTVLFVRHHPIGPRYLPRIYAACGAYLTLVAVHCLSFIRGPSDSRPNPRRHLLGIALLGWLDLARRPILSALTVLVNVLCLLATVDFIYRGHILYPSADSSFSRLGFVSVSSASIAIRAPNTTAVELQYRGQNDKGEGIDSWTVAETIRTSDESDWTGIFHINGLTPGTEYTYRTNASHEGTFKTSPSTLKKFTFVSTSCIKPFYPYNPLNHALRIPGLEHLGRFASQRTIDFVLFLGDFIYIDLPLPLGWSREHYTTLYRQVYASPSWSTAALRNVPWLHVYDDHEIVNDYHSEQLLNSTAAGSAAAAIDYDSALHPYFHYQGHANPPSSEKFGQGEAYYTFSHGDVAFFVLDTRRYRSAPDTPDRVGEKTMLGAKQLADLRRWLETEDKWKVVVSSVPFTRNWRGPDAADSWAGYLAEREVVFEMMRKTEGVVILSGDRHEHATTLFPASTSTDPRGKDIIEFSTSALNQFFEPFSRHHRQIEDTDVAIANFYKGNSKFAAVTFDTSNSSRWITDFELVIDGVVTWTYQWVFVR
ncbi:PhoD-like phosphatase [Microdochium trichocladiopsis]|uniref:PhoD-like phosphatase n=1 Tax=Microdochium trichocladiopsis TaxID=1682393 RepID=A0A9P9BJB3_9PEZI|nr:PhoD-like phosphatase [Microdochium trichocladiopsis]KAH7025058.1 PhoD-like phosphatase [Microdochium trichocladiopsis]